MIAAVLFLFTRRRKDIAMKFKFKKGLIWLAIFLSVLLPAWAFKDYFACRMILVFMVAGYVIYWLIGKLFDVD